MSDAKSLTQNQTIDLFLQALIALCLGIFIFLFLVLSSVTVFQLVYNGRIFPGVYIQDIYLGGLSSDEAARHLKKNHQFSDSGLITLNYINESISVEPEKIGIHLDAIRTAEEAYKFGRSLPLREWLWQQAIIFASHIEIAPVLVFNEQVALDFLRQVASSRDQSLVEAGLKLTDTQVSATTGQIGQVLDVDASLDAIYDHFIKSHPGVIYLQVEQQHPLMMDASKFIPLSQDILDLPFILETPDDGFPKKQWTITPGNLAPMLVFKVLDEGSSSIVPQFRENILIDLLISSSKEVNSLPENPRFIFNDDTRELDLRLEAKDGRGLDVQTSVEIIQNALAKGEHGAVLSFDYYSPEISNSASSQDLGITELIHQENSYFFGSNDARIHNIETAASQFHGLLIPPGETFSMVNAMGEISLDNGYSEALIIYDGRTIEGVGGGVCQVSTTLFRSAFFSGFPIVERHPHAYRVSYYEKVSGNNRDVNLAGLDATVYIPLVDLKFKNDTPYWLLMETYINRAASRLTWKFYSTHDGRIIKWTTTGPINTIEPKKPLYKLNSDLDQGEIKQIDWEAEGADVTVNRSVSKNGENLFEDTLFTRYKPWRAIYEYGPGTDGIPKVNEE